MAIFFSAVTNLLPVGAVCTKSPLATILVTVPPVFLTVVVASILVEVVFLAVVVVPVLVEVVFLTGSLVPIGVVFTKSPLTLILVVLPPVLFVLTVVLVVVASLERTGAVVSALFSSYLLCLAVNSPSGVAAILASYA